MTDDIVTRLRDYLAIVDHAFVWNELSEAADEIERLRALARKAGQCVPCVCMVAGDKNCIHCEIERSTP